MPAENGSSLDLVMGNMVITNFSNKSGGSGYWDTGELPDIDFAKDSLFLILDTDAYYQSQSGSGFGNVEMEERQQQRHQRHQRQQKNML